MSDPCGDGYYLLGDICEEAPPGYVENRSRCEISADSLEAAGAEDFDRAAYIVECESGQTPDPVPGGHASNLTQEPMAVPPTFWEGIVAVFEDIFSYFAGIAVVPAAIPPPFAG